MTIERVYVGQVDRYILEEDWTKFIWQNEELELVERPLTPELQEFKDTYVGNGIAIKVLTKASAYEVLDKLHELGYKWRTGTSLKEDYNIFESNYSYPLHIFTFGKNKRVLWGEKNYYKNVAEYPMIRDKLEMKKAQQTLGENIQAIFIEEANIMEAVKTIAFNKKTFKTTIVLKYGSDEYDTVEVISNKKDFVDFRVGFLLTWLKAHLTGSEFKTLIGQLFFKGKPQITFLRGFALRYFDSLRQMDKVLEAIKDEKDSVNIGGNIIELVWKGRLNE